MNARDQLIDDLFQQALDIESNEGRRQFIAEACGDDAELADEVARLVETARHAEDFLSESAAAIRDQLIEAAVSDVDFVGDELSPANRVGTRVGPYRITGCLGRGGRSTVWAAERTDEAWQQKVAVKILRRGFDTDDVLARFLAERQILLLLNHPGIATILDGGTTQDGLPYFAMQLVDGVPITDYCRRHGLSLHARLRMLARVAQSVEFAHRHLVIHRDVKPSNILVNSEGRPILLDFGIAKIVDPARSEIVAAHTRTETRILTPGYASPEQLAGGPITTATDIYQLGLLMVELLVGRLPPRSDPETEAVVRPSQLLAEAGEHAVPYGAVRLRGDLDIIAVKALMPEPEERYGSVCEFVDDLEAVLANRPVRARAPSTFYRLCKFMKRQPWALPVAGVAAISIVAGLIINHAHTARLEAERDRAEAIKTFLVDFLRAPDPIEGEGREVTVEEALVNAESRAVHAFAEQPDIQAEVLATLASVYTNLDLHGRARELRSRRVALLREATGADSFQVLESRIDLAGSLVAEGEIETARTLLAELIAELGERYPDRIEALGFVYLYAGRSEKDYGDVEAGVRHLRAAVELFRQQGQAGLENVARGLHDLSSAHNMMGRADAALAAIDEAIAIRTELFGSKALQTLLSRVERATTLDVLHLYEQAAAEYETLSATLEDALGPLHNFTLMTLNNEAVTMVALERHDDAERIHRDILARKREKHAGEPAATIAVTLQNLATLLSSLGRDAEAVPLLFEVRDIFGQVLEADNYRNAYPDLTLSRIYAKIGDFHAMHDAALRARRILESAAPEGHVAREMAGCRYGEALIRLGRVDEGQAIVSAAIGRLEPQRNLPTLYLQECRAAFDLI